MESEFLGQPESKEAHKSRRMNSIFFPIDFLMQIYLNEKFHFISLLVPTHIHTHQLMVLLDDVLNNISININIVFLSKCRNSMEKN